ncbi:MAG: hypothetical protein ACI8TQ_003108 [Planctomycetota bacterium]
MTRWRRQLAIVATFKPPIAAEGLIMLRLTFITLFFASTLACKSTNTVLTEVNLEQRETLFAPVLAFEDA